MADHESSEQVGSVLASLGHRDALVRGRAVDELAEMKLTGKVGRLRPLLDDPDWVVRFKAACALAWEGDDAGGPILTEALAKRDLCFLALQALAELGSREALPALQTFFQRRWLHPLERLQAAATLVACGQADAIGWIADKLASSRPEERGFALELWGRLKRSDALERLQAVLADRSDPQRFDALRGLVELDDPRAAGLLRQVAAEPGDPELAAEAALAVEHLSAGRP